MKLKVDHRQRRQTPPGGPWLFWTATPAAEKKEGLAVALSPCPELECECREVTAQLVPVTKRLSALEQRDGKIRCTYQPGESLDLLDRPTAVTAHIDIDFGEVSPDEGTELGPEARDLLDRLRAEIDTELLDQLHDDWLRAKGLEPADTYHEGSWIDDLPDGMVCWQEAFPHARDDVYALPEGIFCVLDSYCINPSCDCTEVAFIVVDPEGRKRRHQVGAVIVDLKHGKPKRFDAEEVPRSTLRRLWKAVAGRHPVRERFGARRARMKEIGAEVLPRLQSAPANAARQSEKIGRNAPCPCGSGKKYKKCCGAPSR